MTSMPQCTFDITRTLPTKILFYAIQLHLKWNISKLLCIPSRKKVIERNKKASTNVASSLRRRQERLKTFRHNHIFQTKSCEVVVTCIYCTQSEQTVDSFAL